MSRTRSFPVHPLLMGAFPVLSLLAWNREQAEPAEALRSLIVCLLGAALLWAIVSLLIWPRERAAAICTLILVLFFSYGHVYNFLKGVDISGFVLGRHRYLAPVWLLLLITGISLQLSGARDYRNMTSFLNLVSVTAVVIAIVQLGAFELRRLSAERAIEASAPGTAEGSGLQAAGAARDIYYIIMDAYGRQDALLELFDYDNSEFVDWLEQNGFYVAACGQSNYAQTELSLASSLNFAYLETLDDSLQPGNTDRSRLRPLILHSAIRRLLEERGYTTVAFESGFYWSQIKDADVYLFPRLGALQGSGIASGLNGFETLLYRTTAGAILADASAVLPSSLAPDLDSPIRKHRDRVLFTLDSLERVPSLPGPKFVFAHVVSPHEPFVFGANGEWVDPQQVPEAERDEDWYATSYGDQVTFLNSEMERILGSILAESSPAPIIILQADHGPSRGNHRMDIFNAYYFPEGGDEALYTTITPVNSFRLMFNRYFGGRYPLLPDESYFSIYDDPFKYRFIPNDAPGCAP